MTNAITVQAVLRAQVTVIATAAQGLTGAPGPRGRQGVPGLSGASFVFDQMSALATWVIAHNLGRFPSVTVVDSAGSVVEGDIRYADANNIIVNFSAAFAGAETPIPVHAGEHIAVVAKNVGVVTTTGVITFLVTFDGYYE